MGRQSRYPYLHNARVDSARSGACQLGSATLRLRKDASIIAMDASSRRTHLESFINRNAYVAQRNRGAGVFGHTRLVLQCGATCSRPLRRTVRSSIELNLARRAAELVFAD